MTRGEDERLARRVLDAHYTDAMVLADEARSYFETQGADTRRGLDPALRVAFACESLKVTTRLMHVIAWLLMRRAIATGEAVPPAGDAARHLGPAIASDAETVAAMPASAQTLIEASVELFEAVARLEDAEREGPRECPALMLQSRLAAAF